MDINWQIAMIAIRMKKFYKKTGRRVRIDGNKPVGFDKKKLECFKKSQQCVIFSTGLGENTSEEIRSRDESCTLAISSNMRSNVNTGRANVNSVRQNVNSVRSNVNTGSFNVNTVRTKQLVPTDKGVLDYDEVFAHGGKIRSYQDEDGVCFINLLVLLIMIILRWFIREALWVQKGYIKKTLLLRKDNKKDSRLVQGVTHKDFTSKCCELRRIFKFRRANLIWAYSTFENHLFDWKPTLIPPGSKGIFDEASYDEEGMVHDFNNLPTEVAVSPIPTLRIHNIHPKSQILGDPKSSVQTRSRVKQTSGAHALVSYVQKQQRNNHKDQQHCLFACFLSQEEPKKISEALKNNSWVEAMQEELLQFRLQQVWIIVDLPHGAKKDKKDIMLVQVYVDDNIFGSTRKSWCDGFEALMKGRFQMISMGELIFFLGLQVKQTITEAEYLAAASCCGQVLWIQNQMLDYGFNFMNTKIHIDNESTICIVKNPVYHSKTKHIEIRHHFIRDSYEKTLIRVEKIHTDFNVADLLTKAFDGPRFNFFVVNIGMINQ
ncbi:hypothetical protein Tco_0798386 [Tanacetum coccineum]